MLISEQGKFIFIHVHKTSGMSIEKVLKTHFHDCQTWHGRHGFASNGIQEIGRQKWDEYFCFAFVRNPWVRMVSWYTLQTKNLLAQRFLKDIELFNYQFETEKLV